MNILKALGVAVIVVAVLIFVVVGMAGVMDAIYIFASSGTLPLSDMPADRSGALLFAAGFFFIFIFSAAWHGFYQADKEKRAKQERRVSDLERSLKYANSDIRKLREEVGILGEELDERLAPTKAETSEEGC